MNMNPGIWFPVEYVLIVDQDWFGENGKLGEGNYTSAAQITTADVDIKKGWVLLVGQF